MEILHADKIEGKVYIGRRIGFMDELENELQSYRNENNKIFYGSVNEAIKQYVEEVKKQIKELQIDSKRIKIDKKGPIVIYHSALLNRQIIHRAVVLLKAKDGYFVLTKGDSIYNSTIDQNCKICKNS